MAFRFSFLWIRVPNVFKQYEIRFIKWKLNYFLHFYGFFNAKLNGSNVALKTPPIESLHVEQEKRTLQCSQLKECLKNASVATTTVSWKCLANKKFVSNVRNRFWRKIRLTNSVASAWTEETSMLLYGVENMIKLIRSSSVFRELKQLNRTENIIGKILWFAWKILNCNCKSMGIALLKDCITQWKNSATLLTLHIYSVHNCKDYCSKIY